MKKILILYTSVTIGHKSIAENIGWHLSRAGFEVTLHDAHQVESGNLASRGTKVYEFLLLSVPFIWKWLYDSKWFISLTLPYRIGVARKHHLKTLQAINELNPDIVISTQVTASGIMAYLKQKNLYTGKFGIAFSDFHLHRYWLYEPYSDFYLANTPEQKREMAHLGIRPEKIFVCGMLLRPKNEVNAEAVKNKFNIGPKEKVVLMASGSLGSSLNIDLIESFLSHTNIKVIVVCGRNQKAFEDLNKQFKQTNATVLGYYTPMDELYAVADIFITKPGGLSVSEALRFRVPILISHLLPGGEQHNYDYLLEKGWAMPEPINLVSQAIEEMETGSFKRAILANTELDKLFNGGEVLIRAINEALSPILRG